MEDNFSFCEIIVDKRIFSAKMVSTSYCNSDERKK